MTRPEAIELARCGYHPPASAKALRRSRNQFGTPEFRAARMKPCGKPATHAAVRTYDDEPALFLCARHAKHNAGRGFPSVPLATTRPSKGGVE